MGIGPTDSKLHLHAQAHIGKIITTQFEIETHIKEKIKD